jgi:phosphoglycolate phosphatase-like HAD superfamily hydrolase
MEIVDHDRTMEHEARGIKIVIFDKDGTLFDSMRPYAAQFGEFIAKRYPEIFVSAAGRHFLSTAGLPTSAQISSLLKDNGIKPDLDEASKMAYEIDTLLKNTVEASVFPDIPPLLSQLKREGKHIWVTSGHEETAVRKDLERENLLPYIDFYAGVRPTMPDYIKGEAHFSEGAKQKGLSYDWVTRHAVMIGDAQEDMRIAVQNRMAGIGRIGVCTEKQLLDAGAKYALSDLSELPRILRRL